ncbi:MAG: replication initiation protein [Clostridiales bacterium]|nr:replication initiation protein [Clostridiales bacterium]
MARKKIEPITSLGTEDKLTVQKSLPLFSLWRSDLTLAEFKILDTYLSRIDSHKPDKRTVVFEKGELEKILGVKRIRTEELDERLKHLGTPIRIDDNTSKNKKFARVSLFEKAVAEQDEYGLWQVELTASQSAMKYFFNVDSIGYLRYKLRCITSLTSRYTYIMFTYLEHNRFRKSWEVGLEELKAILHCDSEETYKAFKRFNDLILKKVQKEMHEKTECRYSYEPIKKGRSVVAVRFTVETLPKLVLEDVDPNQYTLDDWQNSKRDDICHGFSSPEFEDFTDEQLELLKDLGWSKKRDSDFQKHKELLNDTVLACEYAVADYLRQTIIMAKTRHPKNLFLYVKKMIENEG